jgi:hypothetical protein
MHLIMQQHLLQVAEHTNTPTSSRRVAPTQQGSPLPISTFSTTCRLPATTHCPAQPAHPQAHTQQRAPAGRHHRPAPSRFETARKEPPDTKCAPVQRLAVDRAGPGPTGRWLWSNQSASRRWRAHWVAGCELPELCGPQRCGGQKAGVRAERTGQALVAEPKL